jgi:hypothetical protein
MTNFCIESVFYLVGIGIFQFLPFVALSALLAVPFGFFKGWSRYAALVLRITAFNFLLVIWGCFGNYASSALSKDDDPGLYYWSPYEPFATDSPSFQMDLSFAVATWGLALCSFLLLNRYSSNLRAVWRWFITENQPD